MDASSLIGKKATIVGYSTDGAPGHDFVAHICLDIEDGPRVFLQATDPAHAWELVQERRWTEAGANWPDNLPGRVVQR